MIGDTAKNTDPALESQIAPPATQQGVPTLTQSDQFNISSTEANAGFEPRAGTASTQNSTNKLYENLNKISKKVRETLDSILITMAIFGPIAISIHIMVTKDSSMLLFSLAFLFIIGSATEENGTTEEKIENVGSEFIRLVRFTAHNLMSILKAALFSVLYEHSIEFIKFSSKELCSWIFSGTN